jgi:tetratricopeptide (TPR) repeat protein
VAPERVLTREEAARGWLRAAAARKSFPDLMARLEHIQKLPGFPPEFVLSLLDQHYLLMLEQADAVLTTRLYAFCETLRGGKLPADERQFLGGIMLDMSFLQGDFQKALSLVESGAVDFKEDLKRKMVAKIHAHIEMKKGNPREAIRYLREFMGYVAQTEQEEFDPINHVRVSREMILGLNAKRIGDLLVSAGEAGEAGKAFTEARDYYSKALTKYPDENSLENRKIRREMAAIPAP